MPSLSDTVPPGFALPETDEQSYADIERWQVAVRRDETPGFELVYAARPEWCRDCGRGGDGFTVQDAVYAPDDEDTHLTYECPCGYTETVLAAADRDLDSLNEFAPEWEYQLLADDADVDLGVVPPWYFVTHEFSVMDDSDLDDTLGVVAGPFPTARFALHAYDYWKHIGLDGNVRIRRRDNLDLAECRICSKPMLPDYAGKSVNGNGEVTSYLCGACFRQEYGPVINAMMDVDGADPLFPDDDDDE